VRAAVLAGVVALLAGCASELDVEHCDEYDGAPESVERRVMANAVRVDSARVLECLSFRGGSPDEEFCLLSLDPREFDAMFSQKRFFSPRTPPAARFALPLKHGVVLTGGSGGWPHDSATVYFNDARDRALLVVHNFRCTTPRDVVN
jgi:hypothetical protein